MSVLRNPKLAGVLFRLRYIEQFGTGIQKILAVYEATSAKPQFQFSKNLIRVTLLVIKATLQSTVKGLTADEKRLLEQMQSYRSYTRNQLDVATGFDKNKTVRLLRYLQAKSLVRKVGQGRSTRLSIKLNHEKTGALEPSGAPVLIIKERLFNEGEAWQMSGYN